MPNGMIMIYNSIISYVEFVISFNINLSTSEFPEV